MAKQSGLGDQLYISGYDIGADINSIGGLSTPRATLDAPDITQSAMARLFGLRDGSAEFTSYFNPSTNQAHDVLSVLPTTDVHLMYLRGAARDNKAVGLVGKQVDYAPTRGDDGSLTMNTSAQSNAFGLDWCRQLTAGKQTDSAAANSTAINTTASAAFGFQAYLQVFSLASGTATITIQDSADNINFDPVTNGAFTNVTARTVERIQSSSATATVRQYIRVATTGTFSNLVFAVAINKNKNTRAI